MNNNSKTAKGWWSTTLRHLLPTLILMLVAQSAFAQSTQVTGTVLDETGEPLIGASVIEKGTATGSATDFDGNFVLFVKDPASAVLQVSYVGYETQDVALKGQTKITVTLKESSALLDEVVVVGYGQQKKESVVGAISQVNSDDLLETPAANLSQAITGKIPGVITSQTSGAPGADAHRYSSVVARHSQATHSPSSSWTVSSVHSRRSPPTISKPSRFLRTHRQPPFTVCVVLTV